MSQLFFCSKGHVEPAVWRLCPLPETWLSVLRHGQRSPKGPPGPVGMGVTGTEGPWVLLSFPSVLSLLVPPF